MGQGAMCDATAVATSALSEAAAAMPTSAVEAMFGAQLAAARAAAAAKTAAAKTAAAPAGDDAALAPRGKRKRESSVSGGVAIYRAQTWPGGRKRRARSMRLASAHR